MENDVRKEGLIHFIKFTLFSISAGGIQAASFAILFSGFKFGYWLSYLVALTLSVLWNFTLNRKFTFKSAANIPVAMTKVFFYYLIFTPLSTWGGNYFEVDLEVNGYIVLGVTMVLNFVTEFIYTKYFVYHNQINTAVQEK